jgi:hypothetical protein
MQVIDFAVLETAFWQVLENAGVGEAQQSDRPWPVKVVKERWSRADPGLAKDADGDWPPGRTIPTIFEPRWAAGERQEKLAKRT